MKKPSYTPVRAAVAASLLGAGAFHLPATAAQSETELEEVMVLGSRRAIDPTDTIAPVDIIGGEQFESLGATDMDNMLRSLVPSFNVAQQPINDESSIIRPANLRGLPPDNTLVLVNGKRRHRAGVITFLGDGLADGAQGPDVGPIPTIALKQVQVLRDGAAAQYGSDAIAGVINYELRDDADGATFDARFGEFYRGDGTSYQLAANIGLPLGAAGFANLSAEFGEADPTSRHVQRGDAVALSETGYAPYLDNVANPVMVWGQPEVKDSLKFFANLGYELSPAATLYAFGNYATRTTDGGFFYRNPTNRGAVYSVDGGATLLVGDADPDNATSCPVIAITDLVPDQAALAQISSGGALDAECFSFAEMFPGGFTPRFGADLEDKSLAAGVRGEVLGGLAYDASVYYGSSGVDYFIYNTINSSLGPDTPNSFYPGSNIQADTNFNLDLSYPFEMGLASPLNVAFGFEWRKEQFEVEIGQEESYIVGFYADQGFSSGSNGYSGFGPQSEGKFSRENVAVYADLEADFTEQLTMGAAVRWEDFDGFGTTTNWKLSGRYDFTDSFGLRATVSTGFRAPTPGQANIVRTITQNVNGVLSETGVLPPTNPIVEQLTDAIQSWEEVPVDERFTPQALQPEESFSWTAGAAWHIGEFALTVDYFNIELDDRIALSSQLEIDRTDPDQAAILAILSANGVPGATTLSAFQFFTNDFDTRTHGVDVVGTLPFEIGSGQSMLSLALNWTDTELAEITPLANEFRKIQLEEGLPSYRGILTASHVVGPWSFLARASYFDKFTYANDIDAVPGFDGVYGSKLTTDIEAAYEFSNKWSVAVGALDVFDVYPDRHPDPSGWNSGALYPSGSPIGINGGYWYLRANARF